MKTYEDFYLEQLLPLYKQIEELNAEKARRYTRLENDHEQQLEQLEGQIQELEANCKRENHLLENMIFELREDLSPEAAERRKELTRKMEQNRLEMRNGKAVVEASIRKVNAKYRTDKVHLCDEMHDKKDRIYGLMGARRRDFNRQRREEIKKARQEWSPLKRWIFRRFFWVDKEQEGGDK